MVEAVRQEALRKLMHEEDVFFDEAGQHNEFTMHELHERLDAASRSKSAHHVAAEGRPLPQPPPNPPLLQESRPERPQHDEHARATTQVDRGDEGPAPQG